MDILYLLIPLSLVLLGLVVWAFFWAVKSGQFDDLDGPAHRILMETEPYPSATLSNDPDRSNLTDLPGNRHRPTAVSQPNEPLK